MAESGATSHTQPTLFAMIATAVNRMPIDWQWSAQVWPASSGTSSSDPTRAVQLVVVARVTKKRDASLVLIGADYRTSPRMTRGISRGSARLVVGMGAFLEATGFEVRSQPLGAGLR